MITTLHRILERAERQQYAIPAFNVTNLETAQAVISAAQAARSPVIVQTSESALSYAGARVLFGLIELVAEERGKGIPIVIHLDHGKHFDTVQWCIRLGYTSVHMDASELPWARNVKVTKKAVALGHRHGITVQGELGYLLGYEGMVKIKFSRSALARYLTDPVQAGEFVRMTGVDTLAIAIGTAHGAFRGKERIDFERLRAIRDITATPLVLHGGSGVSDNEMKRAIASGIRIVNVDTWLRIAFLRGLAGAQSHRTQRKVDIRVPLTKARLTMEQEATRVIKLLGSYHKA